MKVIIAGDFAPRARLAKQIEEKKFDFIFSDKLRTIIKSADFSFVNVECPIVEGNFEPIKKCGPNLKCTRVAAEAIKFAGFTSVTMANNHILDYGSEGLKTSVDYCEKQGLDIVGVGNNIDEAEQVLYLDKNGKRLAIINCCEHEFSIANETDPGANPLNPVKQFYQIKKAREQADYVVVIVHGGHEHFQLPSVRMVETYRFFIDSGADAVVNHHQHCFSGYEIYNSKPIFYGLGNFCFDISPERSHDKWNYGYLVELLFTDSVNFNIHPYYQYGENATIELLDLESFNPKVEKLNDIISKKEQLESAVNDYYRSIAEYEKSCLEPYSGRICNKLFNLGLLPSFLKKNKALIVRNHIDCESHRDKLLFALKEIK